MSITMEPRKFVFMEQEDPKKKRNRLAQRKHRRQDRRDSKNASGPQEPSSETGWPKAVSPVETGQRAQGMPTTFQAVAMDFSKDLVDLNQQDESIPAVIYPDVQAHVMMEDMEQERSRHVPLNHMHSNIDASTILYDITSQGLSRPSYDLPDFEAHRRGVQGACVSPTQEAPRRLPGPYGRMSRRVSEFSDAAFSVGMSSFDDDRYGPASSVTSYTAPNIDLTVAGSNRCSDRDDSDSELAGNHDLGSRFERIMEVLEEAGFESFDSMLAQYYTASFKKDTSSYWAQSRSRVRSLPDFLASLHESTKNWNDREAQGYRRHIIGIAESLYINEFTCAKRDMKRSEAQSTCDPTTAPSSTSTSRNARDARSVQDLWHAIADLDLDPTLQKKKALICESMPEAWSLLIEWTRKAGLRQSRGSQAAAAFLLLLLDSDQDAPGNASNLLR